VDILGHVKPADDAGTIIALGSGGRCAAELQLLRPSFCDLPTTPLIKSPGAFIKMPSSCKDIRTPALKPSLPSTPSDSALGYALAQCLQESDCIMVQRNKPTDCLRPPLLEELPTKCQQLSRGLGQCKCVSSSPPSAHSCRRSCQFMFVEGGTNP
jgi:Cytochrome c oxidase assembly protein PET191